MQDLQGRSKGVLSAFYPARRPRHQSAGLERSVLGLAIGQIGLWLSASLCTLLQNTPPGTLVRPWAGAPPPAPRTARTPVSRDPSGRSPSILPRPVLLLAAASAACPPPPRPAKAPGDSLTQKHSSTSTSDNTSHKLSVLRRLWA
ncbi:hypothetical protein VTO73DRAFT_8997 [Trametes versicolor]